ncbi:MAG: alpha/beta hydrolase [Algiphilus sp.]
MATLNPHAAQVLALMEQAGQPPLESLQPAEARAAIAQGLGALQGTPTPVEEVERVTARCTHADIPLRVYRNDGGADTPSPAIIFFHGGGFVVGDLDLYDRFCRRLCVASHAAVIAVDYRLAPEHPFPAAVEDAAAVVRWVHTHADELGVCPDSLSVAGDSAGGNLATVAALSVRDDENLQLVHQLLFYPVTDLSQESEGYERCGEGYFLTTELMRYFKQHYLDSPRTARDERASPLLASDLSGLPSATVLVCGFDPLRDEGLAYAEALKAAGVSVDVLNIDDQIHAFPLMDGAIPEAGEILDTIGHALRPVLAARQPVAS